MSTDIEFRQDVTLGLRLWRVQRIVWVAMGAIIVLAMAGVFGGAGFYAKANMTVGDLSVTYDRFIRRAGPMAYEIALRSPGEEPAITLSNALVEGMQMQSFVPQPRAVARGLTSMVLTFEPPPDGVLRVSLRGTAESFGRRSGFFRSRESEVQISQFVYP